MVTTILCTVIGCCTFKIIEITIDGSIENAKNKKKRGK